MLDVVLNDWVMETNDNPVLVEQLDQLGKVGERAGQPVDLVDDHDVDFAGPDLAEQLLQGRPLQGSLPAATTTGRSRAPRRHPSCAWLLMYASQASRWASSELNSRSRLCSVDLRV
jgi:hypothetical protein